MRIMKQYLDYRSISDSLEEIETHFWREEHRNDYYQYEELICEMQNLSSDFYIHLDSITSELVARLPYKNVEFYDEDGFCTCASGIAWFNTFASMFDDCDMYKLLENEDYDPRNIDDDLRIKEKEKRIKAIKRLTKEQIIFGYAAVTKIIFEFMKLRNSFECIKGIIDELDENNSFSVSMW